MAAKLFAAQTFRTKVIYDLNQVNTTDLPGLRDSLLSALQQYSSGPRTIVVQLCLAVAALALQFPTWSNAVSSMIESFGRNPETVPTLLQFLTILPEELCNTRIPVTDDEWHERAPLLLRANAKQVLDLLTMYISASGVTSAVQSQVFTCLDRWLSASEIKTSDVAQSPLFSYMFEALASDALFDSAVDLICDLIHETQEIDDNMQLIQLILPRLIALKPQLAKDVQDPDKIKGYARIFSEAGETYRTLILQHTEAFFPLVEAIGECSAYPDLDVVPITFPFWMRLAQTMGKKSSVSPLLLDAYRSLMGVIIRHLHFPPDSAPLTGQEAENFRSFRHVMGDTLKDCCIVLRTNNCLLATHDLITAALARDNGVSWQEVEAPLFALRSMGAEIDPADNTAVPKIMDVIPRLPNHPKVRYAALLIISRYTEWINMHPDYIHFQLQYISAGFEVPDSEVSAAAGQALKYLCQDCKQHLVDFLPTLHNFLNITGHKLLQDDRRQVYEAIAHVISAMPMERAGETLKTFAIDIVSKIHAVANKTEPAAKEELQEVSDGLENLEVMLHVIKSFGDMLPTACQGTCQEAWLVFDAFIAKYGSDYGLSERTTRVLRHGITLFGPSGLPVAASVIARMSLAFEATEMPSYLWIAGKVVGQFGDEEGIQLRASFQEVYERSTNKLGLMLQTRNPAAIPDVLEDYIHMLQSLADYAPDIFFQSNAFLSAFRSSLTALSLLQTDIIIAALNLCQLIVMHDCLRPSEPTPPKYPIYALAINAAVEACGFDLVGHLLGGIAGDYEDECFDRALTLTRAIATVWPSQFVSWLPVVLQRLPSNSISDSSKTQFLSDITSAVNTGQFEKVKYAVLALRRSARKTRERHQTGALRVD